MSYDPILLVEDDANLRAAIVETLKISKFPCVEATTGEEALQLLANNRYSLVISDINLGEGITGLQLLEQIKLKQYNLAIILITAYASVENAVAAMQLGAADYLVKPFVPEHLISLVERHIRSQLIFCQQPIAVSKQMQEIITVCQRVANSSVNVLITGESGTGKEVLAKYIHFCSTYKDGPFVAVNSAAIPENMLEAMLFGYEKGAFTGAYQSTPGKFELAQNGTLFLDEIGEMPLSLQAKLLRVIQEREVERLGGKKPISLNIRIIAATNKELPQLVEEQKFREDLYFRISVFPINLPPLRERAEDILPLATYILERCCNTQNIPLIKLSLEAQQSLQLRTWPGNIRELENVIQRALVMCDGKEIQVKDLQLGEPTEGVFIADGDNNLDNALRNKEYTTIIKVLKENDGCREKSAKILGISSRTLRYKIAKMKEDGVAVPASFSKGEK